MGKFYIYNTNLNDKKHKDATVIFNPSIDIDINALKNELTEYFRDFHQTSAIVFVHCSTTNLEVKKIINDDVQTLFKRIPKVEESSLSDNLFYVTYSRESLEVREEDGFLTKNIREIINQGLAKIFINNGGLVESNGISHHYVFPSGKHSTKFLRTANVLVRKSEIDFISLMALHSFKGHVFKNIYCDTLSICVIGYSMNQYLKRFENIDDINIESFKSYDGIYNENSIFYEDSIFLISASTSGGLNRYLKEKHPEIDSKNIRVLYYLPIDNHTKLSLESVVCDLSINKKLNYGIEGYKQFKKDEVCKYCENHSSPIKILGDSFNLDEPIINTRNIVASRYITKELKDFVEVFKFQEDIGTSLKVSFSENSAIRKKYSLYIDYANIIKNIEHERFIKHKDKIDAYINQFVPASLKYIIHLNDEGSFLLANYIYDKVSSYTNATISLINQSDLTEETVEKDSFGSILIVGSCITNGKNLLYLNRFFRNYADIRLIYFIGINRISDSRKQRELKSNIKYGSYGPDNSSFIEIESINCDNSNCSTPWEVELDYLKEIQESLDTPSNFIDGRIKHLNDFSRADNKGGAEGIFFQGFNKSELQIRKNSAFFNDNNYYNNITQSDVYFTISCILNEMRNNKVDGLFQTSFVKNLIDPLIFNRFNDGIIQASILRSAKNEELNYSISNKLSGDMVTLLKTFIKHRNEYQGEALLEFIYSLSIGKLRLCKEHYDSLIEDLDNIEDERIELLSGQLKIYSKSCL